MFVSDAHAAQLGSRATFAAWWFIKSVIYSNYKLLSWCCTRKPYSVKFTVRSKSSSNSSSICIPRFVFHF